MFSYTCNTRPKYIFSLLDHDMVRLPWRPTLEVFVMFSVQRKLRGQYRLSQNSFNNEWTAVNEVLWDQNDNSRARCAWQQTLQERIPFAIRNIRKSVRGSFWLYKCWIVKQVSRDDVTRNDVTVFEKRRSLSQFLQYFLWCDWCVLGEDFACVLTWSRRGRGITCNNFAGVTKLMSATWSSLR